jgi:outer membrane protein assembly factor BamB
MKKTLLAAFFFPILFSCDPMDNGEPVDPPPTDSSNLKIKVIWQVPIFQDSVKSGFNLKPHYFGERVVFTRWDLRTDYDKVFGFDIATGVKIWEWEPSIKPRLLSSRTDNIQYSNELILGSQQELYSLDMETGIENWQYIFPDGSNARPQTTQIYDQFFRSLVPDGIGPDVSTLGRSRFDKLQWDSILTVYKTDGYAPHLTRPALWVNPQSDSILIFQNRSFNFSTLDGRIDIYAVNLRTRAVEWVINDLDPSGNSNVIAPPVVYNDKFYFLALDRLYCIDPATGTVVWQRTFDGQQVIIVPLVLAESRFYIRAQFTGEIYCVDPATGNTVFKTPPIGYGVWYPDYYNGHFYFSTGDGKFYVVKAQNGQVMLSEDPPNYAKDDRASFSSTTKIDPVHKLVYADDGFFYMAFKLPEF